MNSRILHWSQVEFRCYEAEGFGYHFAAIVPAKSCPCVARLSHGFHEIFRPALSGWLHRPHSGFTARAV